jgi:Mn-dependent DtxR family transcriptional regulator
MRMEHYVTPELERDLVGGLADARTDPHGRPIPEGEAKGGQSESRSNAGPPAHGSQ